MSSKETIQKAYGNYNKELPGVFNWDWIPTNRGIKYYYLKFVRFMLGR